MGKLLDVRYYMALHRFYKMAYDLDAGTEGTAAVIPVSYSPRDNAPYLGLSAADFEKYTDFSEAQLRQHRWAEQQLSHRRRAITLLHTGLPATVFLRQPGQAGSFANAADRATLSTGRRPY